MGKALYKNLTFQVLTAIVIGAGIGYFWPKWGESLEPLGDGFIRLVTMVVGPIIFLTIVVGIASMGDLKKVGRVGGKALLYFEVVTTLALAIGLIVANVLQPGKGVDTRAGLSPPATTQPATTQPATTQPATTQPASTQAATTQAATTQAATTQAATTQAATTQAATTQAATTQAATTQAATTQAATTQAATTQAATTQAAVASTTAPAIPPVALSKQEVQIEKYKQQAQEHSFVNFVLDIIPKQVVGAFASGNLLQILFFSVMFGIAVTSLGDRAKGLITGLEHLTEVMFRIIALIMKVAPLGAMGAMAFTVGKFGIASLLPLAKLVGCVYLTMILFIFVVLATVCRMYGFSLWRFLGYIKEEFFLVLGTSSSEPALPRLIQKLEILGCNRAVVGLVVPAGYSFNLDGTSIYLSMALLFIAQAFGVPLSLGEQLYLMAVLMLTSKGAAAVTGGGFVTLAATIAATKGTDHALPEQGLALLLGVDRFLSMARALTNLVGNGVATVVVSKMERAFDESKYQAVLAGGNRAATVLSPKVRGDLRREATATATADAESPTGL